MGVREREREVYRGGGKYYWGRIRDLLIKGCGGYQDVGVCGRRRADAAV